MSKTNNEVSALIDPSARSMDIAKENSQNVSQKAPLTRAQLIQYQLDNLGNVYEAEQRALRHGGLSTNFPQTL